MAELDDITTGYQALSSNYVDDAGAIAGNTFRNLGNWRDEDIATFVEQLSVPLEGIKRNAASSAIAYHEQVARVTKNAFKAPSLADLDLSMSALRNGANVNQVYGRPFVQMRMALAKGASFTDALDTGSLTATSFARTEVQLSRRQASLFARRANDNIVGYVRTLTGRENCALCYVASTQRYRKGDLLPIHPACDCGEMPIYGDTDTGQIIDQQLLDQSHEAVGQRFGIDVGGREPDYRKIMIRDHGELGPMLTVKGQKFTGPNSLKLVGKKMPTPDPAVVAKEAIEKIKAKSARVDGAKLSESVRASAISRALNEEAQATIKYGQYSRGKTKDFVDKKIILPPDEANKVLDDVLDIGQVADVEIGRRASLRLKELNIPDARPIRKQFNLSVERHSLLEDQRAGLIAKARADAEARVRLRNLEVDELGRSLEGQVDIARMEARQKVLNSSAYLKIEQEIDKAFEQVLDLEKQINTIENTITTVRVEETKKFIQEVRPVGNATTPIIQGSTTVPHVEYAFKQYPDDWVEATRANAGRVKTRLVNRGGYYQDRGYSVINISGLGARRKPDVLNRSTNTAIHEVGHYMEENLPGLKELEWAYFHRRANGEYVEKAYNGPKELVIEDKWREIYSGKAYATGNPVNASYSDFYEIFTTGAESVLGSSNHFADKKNLGLGFDTDFRQFILGVLLGL